MSFAIDPLLEKHAGVRAGLLTIKLFTVHNEADTLMCVHYACERLACNSQEDCLRLAEVQP